MNGGKGILIVEDENIVALDMRMRLESMGYRVLDVVDQGDLAVERTTALKPDLVLMDIKLRGGLDGIDAARRLRERVEAPVVFVTAFTDEKTLERAMQASPYGYVVKPFRERELRIAIELALYKHQYELSIRKAKELAEAASRLKGEFLANMSHELKTPLNSVIGFTQLAMDRAVDAEQGDLLRMALRSSKSLLTLINSILDFARMEAGSMTLAQAPFSLDSVLADCLDAITVDAYAKGLEVSFYRDHAVTDSLVGDADRLRHVLLNLADNAVKFTDRGFVGLSLAASRNAAPDGRLELVFEMTDSGIGMAADRIDSAFERFTQLDASTTRRAGGTGLGLAIVRKSVDLMGGSIRVESEPGMGTRVAVTLPFSVDLAAAPSSPRPLAGRRVLVAGFDERLARGVGEAAVSLGAEVRYSGDANGAEADELVIADERAFAEATAQVSIGALSGRLIVAARLGGDSRTRIGDGAGLAIVPMPVRAEWLARAADALAARGSESAAPLKNPSREGGSRRAPTGKPPRGDSLLARLADRLDRAAIDGRFDLAERAIKAIKDELSKKRDEAGERLALSALLLARKGDAEGIRSLAERLRSAPGADGDEAGTERT